MKLELKHLAPYLPYALKMANGNFIGEVTAILPNIGDFKITCSNWSESISESKYKPILRPLSDLTQVEMNSIYAAVNAPSHMPDYCKCETVGFNGKEFTYTFEGDISQDGGYEFEITTQVLGNQYDLLQELFKRHYDYFGLIENDLAINFNTLTPPKH
jgi:hypothetical protein